MTSRHAPTIHRTFLLAATALGAALPGIGRDLGDLIKGKVIIDTCNPFVSPDRRIVCPGSN